MADIGSAMAPDGVAVAAGRRRLDDLAEIEAQLTGAGPHAAELSLPDTLTDDGSC